MHSERQMPSFDEPVVDVVDVVVVLKVGMWIGVGDSVKEGFATSISTQSSIQYGPYRGPL